MIDINTLTFKRACFHTINKNPNPTQKFDVVDYDLDLTILSENVEEKLRERLQTAFAHRSRSLELQIGDFSPGTFFYYCKDIKDATSEVFYERSKLLADLLAAAQTKKIIPSGYFMLIEAIDDNTNPVIFVIKAEPHEAFRRDKNAIEVVSDLFLSKGTKLYKIAALYKQDNPEKEYPNDEWACQLFDEQYTPGDQPATYFWKEFLKLDLSHNAKHQTAYFYAVTKDFIERSSMPLEAKSTALDGLKTLVIDSHALTIDPNAVKETLFAPEHRPEFSQKVQTKFSGIISKDTSLIEKRLQTHNLYFPHGVKITGDKEQFPRSVKQIKNGDELRNLEFNPNRTILVIEGKPSGAKQQ